MFNTQFWLNKLNTIIRFINLGYEKTHKINSNKILNVLLKKIKEESIDMIENINFIDEMDFQKENFYYEDGIYILPIDSIDNFQSSIPYFSTILLSIRNNNIEWAIIFFPALKSEIVFNGERVLYNTMEVNGYPPHYLNKAHLNGIDFINNFAYQKHLNANTIVTRNSQSILLMLLMNKLSSGIITEQSNSILNKLILTILKYANISFEKENKYLIIK